MAASGGRMIPRIAFALIASFCASQLVSCAPLPQGRLHPVYNAVFNPTAGGKAANLLDSEKTVARFFLGQPAEGNAIPEGNWTINPKLLESKANIPLTITMTCPFCDSRTVFKRVATYFGDRRISSAAEFEFVPLYKRTTNGLGTIAFQVASHGVQYDNITLDVYVSSPEEIQQPSPEGREVYLTPLRPPPAGPYLRRPPWARDVDVTLTVFEDRGHLFVQVEPGKNKDIVALFGKKYFDEGQIRVFSTGLTVQDLHKLVGESYLQLNGTITNNKELLRELSGDPNGNAPQLSIVLSDASRQALLSAFFNSGTSLYRGLFVDGADPVLTELISKLDSLPVADPPLRVRVETDGVYVPWQFLHPPGAQNVNGFWGFKYELSINPLKSETRYQGPLRYTHGPLVFVGYRGDFPGEDVAVMGQRQTKALQSEFRFDNVLAVNSRDALLQTLNQNRQAMQLLIAYTHVTSGTTVRPDGTVAEEVSGPKLMFTSQEYLPARELRTIANSVPVNEGKPLRNNPLVVLNGCESGTGGYYATTNLDFPGEFLRMGSRGVIATEAPVERHVAYNFGISLMRRVISSKEPIPLALFKTRNEYLRDGKNPLGLLYSYYGGPDVTLSR